MMKRILSEPSCWLQSVFLLLLSLSRICPALGEIIGIDHYQEQLNLGISLCNTTVQGRHLRADDHGHVCKIMELHVVTGCCPENNEQYLCRGCNMNSQCCDSYEFCVSCCLNPMNTPVEVALKTKVAKQTTAGTSLNVFEYCRGRCRHNSDSVVHENAYASENHHCFAFQDNPAGCYRPLKASQSGLCVDKGPEKADADFENLTIVIGRQGLSCDTACKGRGKICKLTALPELNKCTKLKKYFSCKEACIASTGQEPPAEVVSTAPRHMHPGACLYSTGTEASSCSGFHPFSRRLCPCE